MTGIKHKSQQTLENIQHNYMFRDQTGVQIHHLKIEYKYELKET